MTKFATVLLLSILVQPVVDVRGETGAEPAPTSPMDPPSDSQLTETSEPCISSRDAELYDDRFWNDYRYGSFLYESDRYSEAGAASDIALGFSELQPLAPIAGETATGLSEARSSFRWAGVEAFAPRGLMPIPLDPDDMLMQDAKGESDLGVGYKFFASPAVVRVNANVKLDMTYDTGAFTNRAGLNPSFIVLDDTPAARGRGTFDMAMSSAVLKSDIQLPSRIAWTQAYFDLEFNEDEVEFRQLYARVENLLGGLYWTTFGDEGTLPQTLVANGAPAGAIFRPGQVQLHYAMLFESGWSIAGAIERPSGSDITLPADATALRRYPDLVGMIRYQPGEWQSIQIASLVRQLGFEDVTGNEEFTTGWGVSGNLRFFTWDYNNIRLGCAGGEGLGNYLFGLAGNSSAAFADATELDALSNFGCHAGYQHYWTPALFSNLAYGYCESETIAAVPDSASMAQNAWINLIWNLIPAKVALGIEYQYGFRDVNSDVSGDNHHIQFSLQMGKGYAQDQTAAPTQEFGYRASEADDGRDAIPYNRSRRL